MKRITLLFALACVLIAQGASAVTGDPGLIYKIGGAAPVTTPPGTTTGTLTIGGSVDWNMNACGQFDPAQAIRAKIQQIVAGTERAVEQITDSIVASAINYPFYLLQQMDPGKYQMLMNGILRAEESLRFSTRNCQQMQEVIARGGNPYSDWMSVSIGQEWTRQVSLTGDITTADEVAQEEGPGNGIAWVGGNNAGGDGQPPIRPVRDTARVGYNLLLGRDAGNRTTPPSSNSPLVQAFPNPEVASLWVAEVIGDQEIRLTGAPAGNPGIGLLPKVEEERVTVYERLAALVQPGVIPSAQQLAAVSAPDVPITEEVVAALRRRPPPVRAMLLDRLASEVATATIVHKALLARRIIQTGRGESNISAAGPAQSYLNDRALPALDAEIEGMMLQLRVRRELVSDNALRILEADTGVVVSTEPAALSSATVTDGDGRGNP